MPTIIAEHVIPPDQYFVGIRTDGIYAGKVIRTSAGLEVFERADRVVKLLPADWRQRAQEQGQQIQAHEQT